MGNSHVQEFRLRQAEEAEWERVRTVPRPQRSDSYARGIGDRRLHLVVARTFRAPVVWEIRQGRSWELICPAIARTEPELFVVGHEVVPFAPAELETFFTRVTALSLPLRPDLSGQGGCDGTRYELAVYGDLYSGWRFRWWSTWPEQWRPLVELADEMHAAFSAAHGRPLDDLGERINLRRQPG